MFNPRFFEHERHERFFKKGDLKYVILDMIKDKPAHGYEIILKMEERCHGFYTPNPGSIYPVLQLLEDMGYVTASAAEGKKVYTITEAGRAFLQEQQETVEDIRTRTRGRWGGDSREYLDDIRTAMNYCRDIGAFVRHTAMRRDPAKIASINEILAKAYQDMARVYEEPGKNR